MQFFRLNFMIFSVEKLLEKMEKMRKKHSHQPFYFIVYNLLIL